MKPHWGGVKYRFTAALAIIKASDAAIRPNGRRIINAIENAIEKATILILGSLCLAMMAIKKGCSTAIINHVMTKGSQNRKIFLYVI